MKNVCRATLSLLAMLLALVALPCVADDPDIKKLMTPEEYEAAGIDKLSPAEIEALNRWLVRYTAHEAPVVRQASPEVQHELERSDAEVIESQIDGPFRGWSGKTVFRLKNGQVWQQRIDERYHSKLIEPKVQIYKNFIGLYRMRLVEGGKTVPVKRIE